MRTKHELLEFVDRIVGVDKMETQSQFALIELEPAPGKQDEIGEKVLVPKVQDSNGV